MNATTTEQGQRARPLPEGAAARVTPRTGSTLNAPIARTSLADAVHDKLFFAQVREDPRAELAALRPTSDDVVVTVSSGGCTALSLLAAGAGQVVAVDLNATQNHLVELKAAATALGSRSAVAFLGALPSSTRRGTYAGLRSALTPEARRHWDDRPSAIAGGVLRAGVSERFIGAVVTALKLAVHPRSRVDRLLGCRTVAEQRELFDREWNSRRWRLLFVVLCNRLAFRSTYPAQFFAEVENPSFARYFRQLAEHAIAELPVADNYFLHEMLTGRYPVGQVNGVPPYLSVAGAMEVVASRDRLELVDGGYVSYLQTRPDGSVNCFALSNICEWMSSAEIDALFREVLRTAAPGGRLVYRNFVGWTELPAWCARIVPDAALSEQLGREDRSVVQRRVVACRIVEQR
jgi:S-adenosylmethionine-diacylglycerol 3-amino-3-carboxypropyl transferase